MKKIFSTKKLIVTAMIGLVMSGGSLLAESFRIAVDEAKTITLDKPVAEIFVANPEIADFQLGDSKKLYIYGKKVGSTQMFALDSQGNQTVDMRVSVTKDISQLQGLVDAINPGGFVEVSALKGGILLEGSVESPAVAENIMEVARGFADESDVVINQMKVKTPVQVNLHVRVAEVNRTVLNNLGVNLQNAFTNLGSFTFGLLTGRSPFTPGGTGFSPDIKRGEAQGGALPDTFAGTYKDRHMTLNAAIDALSKDGLVSILAEPNLVAISGETASFLAGGEFPYPVPQSGGTDTSNVTIEFKQYGVSLAFTPTVLNGNMISMRVRPEVSELDATTTVKISGAEVPGIVTRRAETTVEMASGQTFAIAGLFRNKVSTNISAFPGLGDVPILGALFRSSSFNRGETELVILVTPYLVQPVSAQKMNAPTDGLNYASFVEQVVEGELTDKGINKGESAALGVNGLRLVGPAGYTIE